MEPKWKGNLPYCAENKCSHYHVEGYCAVHGEQKPGALCAVVICEPTIFLDRKKVK